MILTGLDRYRDIGLLLLRAGLGMMMVTHGGPKIMGGPEMWEKVGGAMGNFGINFAPVFWGFMAAAAEFGGGIALAFGFLFRPACAMLLSTMMVAATHHLRAGDGLGGASHAIELGVVFLALILIGPGRFAADERFARGNK